MIVVATADFEVYHEVVNALRDRGVEFTTIEPDEGLPADADVVVTAESDDADFDVETVVADPDDPRRAVDEALAYLRGGAERTIIGVDPGPNPGIAVLSGDLVVAAFQVPAEDAAAVVNDELAGALDPIVRMGDGARLHGARILDDVDAPIEIVDETGTTPYLGAGARGMDDVLAAVNIARLEGERTTSRDFEPTDGELQVIKAESRERSPDDRTLPDDLARRVARGELSIDDALDQHRDRVEE
ncbi:hypothetical protein [Halocalculus aciditolerans]|uniref:Uncharacterized protein n=1 Tax=Halocalculus aciditolerans TaxID=1383812 RepID=A0A830F0F4_9EURY|nr:hypothetical protein [Halocalculus aciditolerans]GGL50505.1 hypothetical protein GCM10009039_05890 [Halocalculus aciditolerans]